MSTQFKNVDFYGEEIQLTYKGDNKYRTHLGGFISLGVLVIVVLYSAYRLYALIVKEETRSTVDKFVVDLNNKHEIEPYVEYGFDIAFGVGESLDPSLGYFTVR